MATEVETVNIFLERVTKLETDNRRLKQIVTLIVVGAAAALIMGQSRSQPRTFEAEEFVLKDRNGELRGRLYMNGDNPVLYLKGVGEKRELWLEGGSSSGDPGLLVL